MSVCAKCKKDVGCGCNLNSEGLCLYCAKENKETTKE